MNVNFYLGDDLGQRAKAAGLPLSRLLQDAVRGELEIVTSTPFCPGCGQRKRKRWFEFCSKDCAAGIARDLLGAGSGDFYCGDCGDVGCQRIHD